jgi:predicted DNA-binding transcriptional regulator AlpA
MENGTGTSMENGIENPLLSSKQVAELINCSVYSVRISRSTGKLLGAEAPEHIKMGHLVRYRRDTIDDWVSQFEEVE